MRMIEHEDVNRNWKERGFSCGLWVDPPGQRWENYVHRTDELVMLLEGELELEIEGDRCRPRKGEEVFIPAGACHSVRNVGATTARWLYGYRHALDAKDPLKPSAA